MKRHDDGASARAPTTELLVVNDSFLPASNCENTTVGLSENLRHQIYRKLRMMPGDTVVLESKNGRRLEGVLLQKPTDCVLVRRDNFGRTTEPR